jgi:hypothetical protein
MSEYLDARNEALGELPECINCGHHYHAGECEHEGGDRWIDGESMGAWMAVGPCGCRNFEAGGNE